MRSTFFSRIKIEKKKFTRRDNTESVQTKFDPTIHRFSMEQQQVITKTGKRIRLLLFEQSKE